MLTALLRQHMLTQTRAAPERCMPPPADDVQSTRHH
jgi:hypothetical protein